MERFLMRRIFFIFLSTMVFTNCFLLKSPEDTVTLINDYYFINLTNQQIQPFTTVGRINNQFNTFTVTISTNDTLRIATLSKNFSINEDTSFSLVPIPDSNDIVKINFLSTPPKCLVFQGEIPASSLDVRSHYNAADTVFIQTSNGKSELGNTNFEYIQNFNYHIDSTYLNQATEEACTE